ncbi:MAG: PD-(D/E)XK nuclease family protein [Chloroflexota bacterium]
MIEEFGYTPILGWSVTRYDVFSICKRRYFYQYYAKYDREFPVRAILELRDLVSIPLEIGGIVHELIAALLRRLTKSQREIDLQRLIGFAKATTERHLRAKRFEEVYYGLLPDIRLDDLLPRIEQSLESFLTSDRYRWLISEAIATRQEWLIDPPGYGETRLGDMKVYCKVDFLFPWREHYHIVDWKTGKPDSAKHRKQLLGYAAWAAFHYQAQPEQVVATIAYLHPEYSEVRQTFSAEDLDNFAVQVRAETGEMYEYCRDVVLNIPFDKEQFPRVDDDRICGQCSYRRLCFPDRYQAARAA